MKKEDLVENSEELSVDSILDKDETCKEDKTSCNDSDAFSGYESVETERNIFRFDEKEALTSLK